MKKALSFILALTMILCMSVTAFAYDSESSMTISVEVPDNTPSYTMKIPANIVLDPNSTDWQVASGTLGVENVTNLNRDKDTILCNCITDQYLKKEGTSDVIKFTVGKRDNDEPSSEFGKWDSTEYPYYRVDGETYFNYYDVAIKVESWDDVVSGTYTGNVSFAFWIQRV